MMIRRNIMANMIGRAWGAQQLGLYSKAYALLMLPIQNLKHPLNRVAFPVMSRLQNDPKQFRSYFIKYCSFLAFVSMPLVAFLYAGSLNVIRLVLGPRWVGAAELFSILALVSFIQPVASLRMTVQLALGQGGRFFRWGLYNSIVTVVSFLCGLPWGAKGVAIGYCISTYAILHPSLTYAFHDTPIKAVDFYRSIAKPCVSSIAMCIIALLTIAQLRKAPDALVLAIIFPVCCLAYLGIFWLLPGGKREIIGNWEYVSVLRRAMRSKWQEVFSRVSENESQ